MFESQNQHQFCEGTIMFRIDRNTGKEFYDIAFLQYRGQFRPKLGGEKVKNKEHREALERCANIEEIFQIEKKFDVIREKIPDNFRLIVKETHVGLQSMPDDFLQV